MSSDPTTPATVRGSRRKRPRPRGLLRRHEAAGFCGVGTSTWDRLVAAGLTPAAIKLGGSVAWGREELGAWCREGCPPRVEWAPVWAAIVKYRRTGAGG